MGLHNFHICNQQSTTFITLEIVEFSFRYLLNFQMQELIDLEENTRSPMCKRQKKTSNGQIQSIKRNIWDCRYTNWSDWWHEVEFICQRPTKELIVQQRGRGMFFNSFRLKQKLCLLSTWSLLVETICFKFKFLFQALGHRLSSKKLELHLWSRTKDIFLNGFCSKTKLMQSVKYTDLWKLLDDISKSDSCKP